MTPEEMEQRIRDLDDCQRNFMNQMYERVNFMADTLRSLEMKYYTMEAQILALLQRRP